MNDIRIEPWDHLLQTGSHNVPRDQAVPPEVEAVARHVLAYYDMHVDKINLVSTKPAKGTAVWKLATNHGPRMMKLLRNAPKRSLIRIHAQEYLANQGANIPPLIPTSDNKKYVLAGGRLWIVTEWIEALQPAYETNLEEAQALSEALGDFHRLSKGYNPPPEYAPSSVLGSWPASYEKSIEDIGKCRHLADRNPELESGNRLLSLLDGMEEQARDALQRIKQSSYDDMVAMGGQFWGLTFYNDEWSKKDAQAGRAVVWITNITNVFYDFPIRDLRRIISQAMINRGGWDAAWIRGMIEAYHRTHPLDRETFELLLLDLSFPNECYGIVKEILFESVPFHVLDWDLDAILNKAMTMEASKEKALSLLRQDLALYPNGEWNMKTERTREVRISEYSPDEEETIWKDFIQLELNKIQPENPDKSRSRLIATEATQFALRHAASYLAARLKNYRESEDPVRLKKKNEPVDPEGDPAGESVSDLPWNASEEYADVAMETLDGSQTVPNIETLRAEEETEWREFIQRERDKFQPREEAKSPIRAIAPELAQFAFRHLASYLYARLRKAISPSKGETSSESQQNEEVEKYWPPEKEEKMEDTYVQPWKVYDSSDSVPRLYIPNRSEKSGKDPKKQRRRKEEANKKYKHKPKAIIKRVVRGKKKSVVKASKKKIIVHGKSNRRRRKSLPAALKKKAVVRGKITRTRQKSLPAKAVIFVKQTGSSIYPAM
ncbi:CotS family spore coat protein [Cohnella suwonensis]|uniref:CotS family spore coat protein n=1 Tax=Cohnella suwonensis TaxID=696072 RepID=A0ABW0LSE1_9BACL